MAIKKFDSTLDFYGFLFHADSIFSDEYYELHEKSRIFMTLCKYYLKLTFDHYLYNEMYNFRSALYLTCKASIDPAMFDVINEIDSPYFVRMFNDLKFCIALRVPEESDGD